MNSLFVFNCSINWRQTEFSVVADSGGVTMFDDAPCCFNRATESRALKP